MSNEEMQIARKMDVQRYSIQQSMMDDRSFDSVLNNLFVDDSYIKQILRGDVQEPLNSLVDLVETCKSERVITDKSAELICALLRTINEKLSKYQRLTPYLFVLSQLMSLTNITDKEAEEFKCRVNIMIRRDLIMINEDELRLQDQNFYDGLRLLMYTKINDSRNGWKARLLTQPKKEYVHRFEESPIQRKKKWGIF